MNVRLAKIEELHVDPANARLHPEANLAAIEGSLDTFGQVEPIVVQKATGKVIGGNGRLLVLIRQGKTEAWVHEVELDDARATALGLALNQTPAGAVWDDARLAELLKSLPDDLRVATGFGEDDLKELLNRLAPEITEDDAPAPLPDPVSRTADLWVLGEHRLLCGDATKGGDVAILLAGAVPFIMVTDPPYGVVYDANWRNEVVLQCDRRTGVVENDDRKDWTDAYRLFPGHVAYVWHADRFAADLVVNLRAAQFEIRTQIIWRKQQIVFGRGHYHWQHEPCWYAVREGGSSKWCGDRTQSTIWDISNKLAMEDESNHSTQKPVECMARPIRNHGGKDDDVYDPFVGSGTTIVAAEQLKRQCFAIEISPVYVDVAVRRWEKLTGKRATLDGTGKTWEEVAAERGVGAPA